MTLLAPNGKPSNLTPEQYKLVRTPEFKKWFGDWENNPENASKVVDENGEPLAVYHGTNVDFNKFSKTKGRGKQKQLGIYLSNNKKVAALYGEKILECFVNIKTPFEKNYQGANYWDLYGSSDLEVSAQFNRAKSKITSIDGVIFYNIKDALERFSESELGNNYIAFYSNQIKLADGSNTTFDGSNPDITYSHGGSLNKNKVKSMKFRNGGDIENALYLDFYKVSMHTDTDALQVAETTDYEEAQYQFYNCDIDRISEKGEVAVTIEKKTNKYVWIGDYEYDINDFDLEYYFDDSSLYELIEEGDYIDLDYRTQKTRYELEKERVSDVGLGLLYDILTYLQKICAEYKHAGYVGTSFYGLMPYRDGNIIIRLSNHFFNPSNVQLGYDILWQEKFSESIPSEYRNIFGFISINILDSNYIDRKGFYREAKQSNKLITFMDIETNDYDADYFDWKNELHEMIDDMKKKIDVSKDTRFDGGGMVNNIFDYQEDFYEPKKYGEVSYKFKNENEDEFNVSLTNINKKQKSLVLDFEGNYSWETMKNNNPFKTLRTLSSIVKYALKKLCNDGFIINTIIYDATEKKSKIYKLLIHKEFPNAKFKINQFGSNEVKLNNNPDIRFDGGANVEYLISKGIVELKMFDTKPEHAKEYGLDSVNPLYVQSICVKESERLKGIGNKVLQYIYYYATKNGNDVIFGHITQKASFTKDSIETNLCDVDMIKNWLQSKGYSVRYSNNDFHKIVAKIDSTLTYQIGGL